LRPKAWKDTTKLRVQVKIVVGTIVPIYFAGISEVFCKTLLPEAQAISRLVVKGWEGSGH
jgi:hypothetical protein